MVAPFGNINLIKSGVLASGGGTADRNIRFWDTKEGTSVSSIDTGSQVCQLHWSEHCDEIVSTHGFSQNEIAIWKFPSMFKIASLLGHSCRVVHLGVSPDGCTVVTGAGDETLRFWNVFEKLKPKRVTEYTVLR